MVSLLFVLTLLLGSLGYSAHSNYRYKISEYGVDEYTAGLWHFDEGCGYIVYDETPNYNDGTLQNGASHLNITAPIIGSRYSINFDGVDDSIKILDSSSLDIANQITVEAWIYVDDSLNTYPARIVSKWQTNNWWTGRSYLLQLVDYTGEPNHVGFWIRNTIQPGTNDQDGAVSTHQIPINKWVHVAGVFNGTDIMVYVNGKLEGTKHFPVSIYNSITNLGIGADVDDPNQYNFKGYIDEVRISNKARSPSEFNVP